MAMPLAILPLSLIHGRGVTEAHAAVAVALALVHVTLVARAAGPAVHLCVCVCVCDFCKGLEQRQSEEGAMSTFISRGDLEVGLERSLGFIEVHAFFLSLRAPLIDNTHDIA